MVKQVNMTETNGNPLAVCINDCEIDYGQPGFELAKVCFRLGCAFAEMRWGNPVEETDTLSDEAEPVSFFPGSPSELLSERWQR
jgi:hypothetical protein